MDSQLLNLAGSVFVGVLSYLLVLFFADRLIESAIIEGTYLELRKFLESIRFSLLGVFKKSLE